MTKAIFLFIASTLLLLPLFEGSNAIPTETQFLICFPFILTLGIPHGALDNVLYLRNNSISNTKFIAIYLTVIAAYILLWLSLPLLAYSSFLLLSAYHFGQSQFTHYLKHQRPLHQLLYLAWGSTILAGLIYFNLLEIRQIMAEYPDFQAFEAFHNESIFTFLFYFTGVLTLGTLFYLFRVKQISTDTLLMEVLVITLILVCFYLLPLLVGFTLYFVILHSFKVLKEEFDFLKNESVVNGLGQFMRLLAPFTLFSVFGVFLLFGFSHFDLVPLSYGYLFLIIISAISLPHIFVMHGFYDLLFSKEFYKANT